MISIFTLCFTWNIFRQLARQRIRGNDATRRRWRHASENYWRAESRWQPDEPRRDRFGWISHNDVRNTIAEYRGEYSFVERLSFSCSWIPQCDNSCSHTQVKCLWFTIQRYPCSNQYILQETRKKAIEQIRSSYPRTFVLESGNVRGYAVEYGLQGPPALDSPPASAAVAQMMANAGWDGEAGLGRHGQGIKYPIKARSYRDEIGASRDDMKPGLGFRSVSNNNNYQSELTTKSYTRIIYFDMNIYSANVFI